MIGKLKTLGLAALVAMAASALFAAGAQGQLGTLTAGETPATHEPATIIGQQYGGLPETEEDWNFFSTTPGGGPGLICHSGKLTDTTDDGAATILTSVEADYVHCQIGGQPATVLMNGCEYTLDDLSTIRTDRYTGNVYLTCPEGERIEIKVYLFGNSTETSHSFLVCTIEVWPSGETSERHETQRLSGHAAYKNVDPARGEDHVTATLDISGLRSFDGCETSETHSNGVYKQTLTVKAFEDEGEHSEQLDLWIGDE